MKRKEMFIVFGAIVLFIAVSLNPNKERHQENVKSIFMKSIQKDMSESMTNGNDLEIAGSSLGAALAINVIDQLIKTSVTRDNYFIFSMTRLTWEGESRIVAIGVLDEIYVFDDKLRNYNQ